MIDTNKLKGIIAEKGLSQTVVAKGIGVSNKTFYTKMKKGVFGSDEIDKIIDFVGIENPLPIFFANKVTSQVTKEKE